MRLLVLGGTAWLGTEVVRQGLERGDEATCLARGRSGNVPDGVRFVPADRDEADALEAVPHDEFDAVIDLATQPGHVRRSANFLAPRVGLYCFVSSISVYRDHISLGQDETGPTFEPLAGDVLDSMADYGAAKRAAEVAVSESLGERALIVRPGLIGGPGDTSGRTGYWPHRFAHPASADGTVLVPDVKTMRSQIVDVRDLAAWILRMCASQHAGVFNAAGDSNPLDDVIALARDVAGHRGPLRVVASEWLLDRGVNPWSGPRSLPLWLPWAEYAGHGAYRHDAATRAGLALRPLRETLDDTLAWERHQPIHPHGAGLSNDEERELLAVLDDPRASSAQS